MPCYKDEKTGTWYCQFRYADFTGKRKQKRKRGFKTKSEMFLTPKSFRFSETGK